MTRLEQIQALSNLLEKNSGIANAAAKVLPAIGSFVGRTGSNLAHGIGSRAIGAVKGIGNAWSKSPRAVKRGIEMGAWTGLGTYGTLKSNFNDFKFASIDEEKLELIKEAIKAKDIAGKVWKGINKSVEGAGHGVKYTGEKLIKSRYRVPLAVGLVGAGYGIPKGAKTLIDRRAQIKALEDEGGYYPYTQS
jgi:hypothetical protein